MAEQKEESVSFRITYFGFTGRAAPLRCAATLGGLSYEDNFTTFPEHGQAKQDGTRRWKGLPELTVFDKDGKELTKIGQSNACLRYIGTLTGLYPENPLHRALCDEVLDSVEDIQSMVAASIGEKDADKLKALRLSYQEADKLPYWLNKFESRLEENEKRGNKNGYFVGDSISIADLKAYYALNFLVSLDHIDGDKLLTPNKRIVAFRKAIGEYEGVKKFDAQFAEQQKENKENKKTTFKLAGKGVYGSY